MRSTASSNALPAALHCANSSAIHMDGVHESSVGLIQSVDSGISLPSMGSPPFSQTQGHIEHTSSHISSIPQPTPYLMPSSCSSRHITQRPLPKEPGGGQKEGFYHRLNHNPPSCASVLIASRLNTRHSSSSSNNSASPLLQSQSSSELEDSLNGSVFITNPAESQQWQQFSIPRQRSHSAADPHHVIECDGTDHRGTDNNMIPNPAYGSNRMFKISTDKSEKPHVYETVA